MILLKKNLAYKIVIYITDFFLLFIKRIRSTILISVQGCHMVRKSQEKLKKMTKVRKRQVKMGVFEKSQEKFKKKKTSKFVSSNLPNSLYFDW